MYHRRSPFNTVQCAFGLFSEAMETNASDSEMWNFSFRWKHNTYLAMNNIFETEFHSKHESYFKAQQNQQNDICALRRLRSVWAPTQFDQSLHCPPEKMKMPRVLGYPLSAQWRIWSDWVDAQIVLSLCWVHKLVCWSCHAWAQVQKWATS